MLRCALIFLVIGLVAGLLGFTSIAGPAIAIAIAKTLFFIFMVIFLVLLVLGMAAFVSIADPVNDGARIAAAVKAGFIVSTRADDETREARLYDTTRRDAAFAGGAQIVSSDFAAADPAIGPYRVSLKDNPAALCGAALGADACVRFTGAGKTLTAALP